MRALLAEGGVHDLDDWRRGPEEHCTPNGAATEEWGALVDAVYTWAERFGDRLLELQDTSPDGVAEITVENVGNLIAFSSGWGDGGYPSFFGYDSHDHLACLVTDFGVLLDAI
jgi:hypothetical protein